MNLNVQNDSYQTKSVPPQQASNKITRQVIQDPSTPNEQGGKKSSIACALDNQQIVKLHDSKRTHNNNNHSPDFLFLGTILHFIFLPLISFFLQKTTHNNNNLHNHKQKTTEMQ